jgi:hypothetical protein
MAGEVAVAEIQAVVAIVAVGLPSLFPLLRHHRSWPRQWDLLSLQFVAVRQEVA